MMNRALLFIGALVACFDPHLIREAVAAGNIACSERDEVLAQLGSKYKEAPSAIGLANNGGLIEVLTSDDGSTWTIIVSMPNGTSCLLAAGENWQPIKRVQQGSGI